MELTPGTRLHAYEITAAIGAGGMGVVYRARDTRLGRDVAIKVLPSEVAIDSDRLARFEREAQILAALNHPNIASIYGVEDAAGSPALVMELVDGPTLAYLIATGPIAVAEALPIARQIAEALETAHEQGIVHRDLKPANIKVRPDGAVKVLDFGLAKALDPGAWQSGSATSSPTISMHATRAGVILGTAAYMAPEQARGKAVDRRADLWAFGVVLYEMLAGTRLFGGDEISDTLALVLTSDPDWTKLPANTPEPIRRLLRRCLDKDPKRRLASASDARLEIDDALRDPAAPVQQPSRTGGRSLRLWQAMAVLATLIALALGAWTFRPSESEPASRVDVSLPEGVNPGDFVSVSPDGRKLILTAGPPSGLWMRDLASLEWRRLAGTEGAATPFRSPDSRYVAFALGTQLKKLDTTGGPPETLCTVPAIAVGSGSWNRDGTIIFGSWGGGSGGPLWRVSQAGGPATALTEVDVSRGERYHTWPTFLEDGRHFLYFRSGPAEVAGIYAGSLDTGPAEQPQTRIVATPFTAGYAGGYLFFMRATTMMAQPFDRRRLELTGAPVAIADAVQTTWYGTDVFSVSSGRALAYATKLPVEATQLTWADRAGTAMGTIGSPGPDAAISLSPDGTRAMVRDAGYSIPGDLWIIDVADGRRTRFTFRGNNYSPGVWSPDSTRVAYAGGNLGDTVYVKPASGTTDEIELLKEPGTRHFVTSWSPDGRFLLYHTENVPNTGYDVWVLPLEGERKPVLLAGERVNEWAARFSPDGRWIVHVSLESTGVGKLVVRPFTVSASGTPGLGEGRWELPGRGNWPVWRSQQEIVFSDGLPWNAGTPVMAVPVKTSRTAFESGVPKRLFLSPGGGAWDTTRDGQRFLTAVPRVQRTVPPSVSVILNWPALLKLQ
jgi:serine/threonine protein kinase/Tol biopolymer transport system component